MFFPVGVLNRRRWEGWMSERVLWYNIILNKLLLLLQYLERKPDHPGFMRVLYLDGIGIWRCRFLWRKKTREKPSKKHEKQQQPNSTHTWQRAGIEPGPRWWETSTLRHPRCPYMLGDILPRALVWQELELLRRVNELWIDLCLGPNRLDHLTGLTVNNRLGVRSHYHPARHWSGHWIHNEPFLRISFDRRRWGRCWLRKQVRLVCCPWWDTPVIGHTVHGSL